MIGALGYTVIEGAGLPVEGDEKFLPPAYEPQRDLRFLMHSPLIATIEG